jgi:hypothetical protein
MGKRDYLYLSRRLILQRDYLYLSCRLRVLCDCATVHPGCSALFSRQIPPLAFGAKFALYIGIKK